MDPVQQQIWDKRCAQVMNELHFDVKGQQQEDKAKRKAYLASEVIGKFNFFESNQKFFCFVEESCIPIINDMHKGK